MLLKATDVNLKTSNYNDVLLHKPKVKYSLTMNSYQGIFLVVTTDALVEDELLEVEEVLA